MRSGGGLGKLVQPWQQDPLCVSAPIRQKQIRQYINKKNQSSS